MDFNKAIKLYKIYVYSDMLSRFYGKKYTLYIDNAMGMELINTMNARRNRYTSLKFKMLELCFPQNEKSIFDVISESKGTFYFYMLRLYFASKAPIPNFS